MKASERERLIGCWRLAEYRVLVDGKPGSSPFGDSPTGQLIYSDGDRMSALLMRPGRPPMGSRFFATAPVPQRAEAAAGFLAYAGRFEVDGELVLHHVELSLFPDWVGRTLRRRMSFPGDDRLLLELPVQETSSGTIVQNRLLWIRHGRSNET